MAARSVVQSHLQTEERTRARAYEIYLTRGGREGSALDDWLQAEREILGGEPRNTAQDRATVVGYAGTPNRVFMEDLGDE